MRREKSYWWILIVLVLVLAAAAVAAPKIYVDRMLVDSITLEAGDELPEASDYLKNPYSTLSVSYLMYPQVDSSVPGDYSVVLECLGQTVTRGLVVQDTIAPTATTKNITITVAELPEPEDFLVSVTDGSAVTATYVTEPSLTGAYKQTVQILLTDAAGNTATVDAKLTVDLDTVAPVITGAEDIMVYVNGTVSYRENVTVTDDHDENPTLIIESDSVDLTTPGTYIVTYIASDSSGNEARQEITVTVVALQSAQTQNQDQDQEETTEIYASLAEINSFVDNLLSTIITDDMTTLQQAKAVFQYIRGHCTYIGSLKTERGDYRQIGYLMLTRRTGDCYHFFAAAKLLLEALDIPNIDVVKEPNFDGDGEHFWSLVSVDGGETYYHFDTTPRSPGLESFMLTDAELDAYSKANSNCYNRDTSLYPATPEEGPEE